MVDVMVIGNVLKITAKTKSLPPFQGRAALCRKFGEAFKWFGQQSATPVLPAAGNSTFSS
jgi:hypothetical protein